MDIILSLPSVLFAITIHEYAHAYVATRLGDPTPYFAGRLTLNPIKHIDPIGAVVFLLTRFGWAKPVPVDAARLGPKGMKLVSLAGPMSNLLAGIASGLLTRFVPHTRFFYTLFLILYLSFMLNIAFAIFNLIPIPPLDGSHILETSLPLRYRLQYRRLAVYSPIILITIIIADRMFGIGILWGWIGPIIRILSNLVVGTSYL